MHLDHDTAAEGQTLEITQMALASVLLRKDLDNTKTLLEQGIVVVEDFWDREAALKQVTKILQQFTGEEQYA